MKEQDVRTDVFERDGPIIPVMKICQFAECPVPVYRYYVDNIQSEPTVSSVMGILEHECRRRVSELLRPVYVGACFEDDCLDKAYDVIKSAVREVNSRIRKKYWMFQKELNRFEADLIFRLNLEEDARVYQARTLLKRRIDGIDLVEFLLPYKTEYEITSYELGIRGRIDALYRTADGLVPVDYKSGLFGFNGNSRRLSIQMTAYAMLLECEHQIKVDYGKVYFTRLFSEMPIIVTDDLRAEVLSVRDKIVDLIENPEQPSVAVSSRCGECLHRSICEMGGSEPQSEIKVVEEAQDLAEFDSDWIDRLFDSPEGSLELFSRREKEVMK